MKIKHTCLLLKMTNNSQKENHFQTTFEYFTKITHIKKYTYEVIILYK